MKVMVIEVIRRAEAETKVDTTMRCVMVDRYVENFDVACWHPRGVQNIVYRQATKYVLERIVRLHMTI